MKRWLAALVIAACGSPQHGTSSARAEMATEMTLYRDLALVKQRVEVVVPASKHAIAQLQIPPGVAFTDVSVVDRGELAIKQISAAELADATVGPGAATAAGSGSGYDFGDAPGAVQIEVDAPRAGTFAFTVAYTTVRLAWDAAYTVTTTSTRDDAVVAGAIAIRNSSRVAFTDAHVWVVDDLFAAARQAEDGEVAAKLTGAPAPTAPRAVPREIGVLALGDGETRVSLIRDAHRTLHAVLVYDPIGTELDNPAPTPMLEPERGLTESKSGKVSESFELTRDEGDAGLPGGPVRLLERRPDGMLSVLADGTLYGAASRAASTDTVPVGVAEGVTAKRERRDFSVDTDAHRAVEEFSIQVTSTRGAPLDVLVREHMYRGKNWGIAYIPQHVSATKEGEQQVSMRTRVPANGKAEVYYVVVYTWPKS